LEQVIYLNIIVYSKICINEQVQKNSSFRQIAGENF
jgi:hypothetical protein